MNAVDLIGQCALRRPALVAAAWLTAASLCGGAAGADAPWRTGTIVIGKPLSKMEQKCAADFAGEMTRRGAAVEAWTGGAVDWQRAPAGVEGVRWLALTAVRLDNHLELLLFRPRAASGCVDLVGRQPATMNTHGTPVIHTGPQTGPGQDMRWAATYLAMEAAAALAGPDATAARSLVRVAVDPGDAPGSEKNSECMALAFAAAARAGLRPTLADQPARLTASLTRPGAMNRLRVTFDDGARRRTVECAYVPNEGTLDALAAAIHAAVFWKAPVAHMAFVSPAPATVFGVRGGAVLVESGERVAALDVVEGTLAWLTPPDTYHNLSYAGRPGRSGTIVYQYTPFLDEVSFSGGRSTQIMRARASFPWSFNLSRDGRCVAVAEGPKLALQEEGRALWARDGAGRWTAGPLLTGDAVFAAEEGGRVVCFTRDAAGREKWRSETGERLYGPLTLIGGRLFAASQEGELVALSASDGRPAWKARLDDRVVGVPVRAGDGIAAASGSGGVRLFDAASGEQRKEWKPRGAISHFGCSASGGGRLVCADLSGVVTVLAGDLRVIDSLSVPGGIGVMIVAPLPRAGGAGGLSAEDDGIIIADRNGVVTVVPIAAGPAAEGGKPQ